MSDSRESLVAFSGFGQPSIISGIPEQVRPSLSLLLAVAACDALGAGGGGGGSGAKVAESGTKRGSAGGYSAQLSSELGKQGVEPQTIGSPGPAPKGTGSAAAVAPTPAPVKEAGSAATPVQSPTPANAGSAEKVPANVPDKVADKGGEDKATPLTSTDTSTPKNMPAPPTPAKGIANRVPVKPNAEQAQIKFDLEPNWERDIGESGTFSLVVKVPSSEEQRVFYARYSFEDQSAPPDCDSYRKFLEDKKLLTVTLNRQRGAACYVEGTDASGVAMYRYLVTYSGKRLLCTGSLYKDQAALGDLRDKVLMQAKKICETLAL